MKKIILPLTILALIFAAAPLFAADSVLGYWKTIDDETGKAKSVIAIYEYQGKIFGRILMTFEDDGTTVKDSIYVKRDKANKVKGTPPYCGLDIIYNLVDTGSKFSKGNILDPLTGKVYASDVWKDKNGNLIVKGKIGPIGKSQVWKPFSVSEFPPGFTVPDSKTFVPVIAATK
ncbi:MAG TPA: DUF2147 domain-containing protein [Spirochaetia bacterium]|jgi:uncharacterized protein (DUF2147 family)|nr:DUF2147 domain-containing protein [Spirochaetia bacterium]